MAVEERRRRVKRESSLDSIDNMTAGERNAMLSRFKKVHCRNEVERRDLILKKGPFDGSYKKVTLSVRRDLPYPY